MKNKTKNLFRPNTLGFTLIEIMVSFSILTVAFIAIMQSFPTGLKINKTAENATLASFLAQDKIEEFYSLDYDNIPIGTVAKARLSNDTNNYLYFYQRETTVNYVDANLANSAIDTGLKKISVTIYYTNSISKTETSYNITTLISRR